MEADANEAIAHLGLLDDDDIVLDHAALLLASLDHPGVDLAPYHDVLDDMAKRIAELGGDAQLASDKAHVLASVIAEENGFVGDAETYDNPANADLIRVVDRRRGLPVALAIIYVALARRAGWRADALNTPGHVLVRIGRPPANVVIDPFGGGAIVGTGAVAALVVGAGGARRTSPLEPVEVLSSRGTLTRLLTNQAERARSERRLDRALTVYERMTVIDPASTALWWRRAGLEKELGRNGAARASLRAILETTRDPELRARVMREMAAEG